MTRRMMDWVKLPTAWIEAGGLKDWRWTEGQGADAIAGLLVTVALAQHADQETGEVRITYDAMTAATGLSRAKLSRGLSVAAERGLIVRGPAGRSTFQIANFHPDREWGKLPAAVLYVGGVMPAFQDFTLRKAAELNALRLYLLFVARRDRNTNMANISYDKVSAYTGIDRARIKPALSVLAVNSLVSAERVPSTTNDYSVANAYRLARLDSGIHMGTRGRRLEAADFDMVDLG